MAPVRGERSVPLPWGMPLGHGHEWGGSKLDQQRTPPKGVNATQRCPSWGFTAQHPLPSPPSCRRAPRHSPQAQIPQVGWGRRAGGVKPAPQPLLSVFFKRFPTTIGSVRKLIVYKYPKLRKTGWGGGVALKEVAQCVDGVQAGGGHHPSLPLLSWQERVPPPTHPSPHRKAGSGQPLP